MFNLVSIMTDGGSLSGTANLRRMNSGGVYLRRKFAICSTFQGADAFYAVEQTDYLKVQMELVRHALKEVYTVDTSNTG